MAHPLRGVTSLACRADCKADEAQIRMCRYEADEAVPDLLYVDLCTHPLGGGTSAKPIRPRAYLAAYP